MATDDQSLATLIENWIVTKIAACTNIPADNVEAFAGLSDNADSTMEVIEELRRNRTPWVMVSFERRPAEQLSEGDHDWEASYAVFLIVQNARPGAARRGDGTTAGANLLLEEITEAFDAEAARRPNLHNYLYSDSIRMGEQVVLARPKGICVVQFQLFVQESIYVGG